MPEQTTDPATEVDPKWLLIMERLKVNNLAVWLRTFRAGNRASNPDWRSWESIAWKIREETRVSVSANGLRSRWQSEVEGTEAPEGPVPARDATGPTGNPAEDTR